MEFTFSTVAMIVAASQSFLLLLLIVQKYRSLYANRFLALLLLCYTLILVHLVLQDSGAYTYAPALFVLVGCPLLAMPLHYLYTKYLIDRRTRFDRKDWVHGLPFAAFELALVFGILFSMIDLKRTVTSQPASPTPILRVFNWFIIAEGLFYLGTSYRTLSRYQSAIKDVLSSIEQVQLQWLRNITVVGLTAVSLFFIEDLLMMRGINLSNFIFTSVFLAAYVFGMGYVGFLKSEIFSSPAAAGAMEELKGIDEGEISEGRKYERSGLSDEDARRHLEALLALMEEKKPYLESALTLSQLAALLSISPHNLSEVINTREKKSFYDFINGYRVDRVKIDLIDPAKRHMKILSLGFDAGFNSKAAFNTVFKQHTGMTPSDFRRKNSK